MVEILRMLVELSGHPDQLALLTEQMRVLLQNVQEEDGFSPLEMEAIRAGRKIVAVKSYRDRKGLQLKDALAVVSTYMAVHGYDYIPNLTVHMYAKVGANGIVECRNWPGVQAALREWFYTDRASLPVSKRSAMRFTHYKVFRDDVDVCYFYNEWARLQKGD